MFFISRFKDGDIDNPKYRKDLVDIFVNSVFLYDDKVVITFNWKDGTKTVTLAELEDAMDGAGDAQALQLGDIECSHLDENAPPLGTNANSYQFFFVGETFAFSFTLE